MPAACLSRTYPRLGAALTLLFAVLFVAPKAFADEKEACAEAAEAGQRARMQKHFHAAHEQLLTCARGACPGVVKNDCARWLGEVDAATPTIVFRARDPGGHDILDVKVYFDDQLLQAKLDGMSVPVDPGAHKIRYELLDGSRAEETVIVVEGEKDRILAVPSSLTSRPASAKEVAREPAPQTSLSSSSSHETTGPATGAWIVGAVGVAGLVGFGALQAVAQTRYSDLNGGCGVSHSCSASDLSSVRSEFVASGILLGVGVAGVGTGIVWWLFDRYGHKGEGTRTGHVDAVPLFFAGGGGGVVRYESRF
jgi:hypothetical protein